MCLLRILRLILPLFNLAKLANTTKVSRFAASDASIGGIWGLSPQIQQTSKGFPWRLNLCDLLRFVGLNKVGLAFKLIVWFVQHHEGRTKKVNFRFEVNNQPLFYVSLGFKTPVCQNNWINSLTIQLVQSVKSAHPVATVNPVSPASYH